MVEEAVVEDQVDSIKTTRLQKIQVEAKEKVDGNKDKVVIVMLDM